MSDCFRLIAEYIYFKLFFLEESTWVLPTENTTNAIGMGDCNVYQKMRINPLPVTKLVMVHWVTKSVAHYNH